METFGSMVICSLHADSPAISSHKTNQLDRMQDLAFHYKYFLSVGYPLVTLGKGRWIFFNRCSFFGSRTLIYRDQRILAYIQPYFPLSCHKTEVTFHVPWNQVIWLSVIMKNCFAGWWKQLKSAAKALLKEIWEGEKLLDFTLTILSAL